MTTLDIQGSSVPLEIKKSLQDFSRNIEFHREDATGANGFVFFGANRITGDQVTLKYYYWGGNAQHHAEPQQLAQINSVNVLRILDAGLLDESWAYFMTPTCTRGDLDVVLHSNPIGVRLALDYSCHVLSGLSHLHAKRFLHRDIKPANLYLDQNSVVVIGDFGSVKRLPEAHMTIPASSLSLLYRPPETIVNNSYGITGDIYQCGLVLYQLLGGSLSYDGYAWLSKRELAQSQKLTTEDEQQGYIDGCIKAKIVAGNVVDIVSLPPWVPRSISRIINKACHVEPARRFQSASAFMAKVHEARSVALDWQVLDGYPTLIDSTSYRIISIENGYVVQKRVNASWRKDNTISGESIKELIKSIIGSTQKCG